MEFNVKTHLSIGDKAYVVEMPSRKTVMCENLGSDKNFDEKGICKKDCFKDCILPQAYIDEITIEEIEISVDREEICGEIHEILDITYNEFYGSLKDVRANDPDLNIRDIVFDTREEAGRALKAYSENPRSAKIEREIW